MVEWLRSLFLSLGRDAKINSGGLLLTQSICLTQFVHEIQTALCQSAEGERSLFFLDDVAPCDNVFICLYPSLFSPRHFASKCYGSGYVVQLAGKLMAMAYLGFGVWLSYLV